MSHVRDCYRRWAEFSWFAWRLASSLGRVGTFVCVWWLTAVGGGTPGVVAQSVETEWTRFRGPNGAGVAEHLRLPEKWSTSDFVWSTSLAGTGSSSPVAFGDRVFVTSCDDRTATLFVQCLHADTGRELWRQEFSGRPYRMHGRNSFASSTPCVDAERVYVAYADPEHTWLVAIDHDGKQVWRRDFGRWVSMHGFGASPMRYGRLVVLHCSQQAQRLRPGEEPGESRMVAVRGDTGQDVWIAPLETTIANYSVPCVRHSGTRDELVCLASAEGFFALDPDDGQMLWQKKAFKMRTVASPVLAGDLVLGSNGSGGGGNYLVAVRPDRESAQEIYRYHRSAAYVPTPVVWGALVFLCGDKGVVSCLEASSGDAIWRKRMASGFSGSPIIVGQQVVVMDDSGRVLWFEARRDDPDVSSVELGEATRATPSVCGDRILFRTDSHLYCLVCRQPNSREDNESGADR